MSQEQSVFKELIVDRDQLRDDLNSTRGQLLQSQNQLAYTSSMLAMYMQYCSKQTADGDNKKQAETEANAVVGSDSTEILQKLQRLKDDNVQLEMSNREWLKSYEAEKLKVQQLEQQLQSTLQSRKTYEHSCIQKSLRMQRTIDDLWGENNLLKEELADMNAKMLSLQNTLETLQTLLEQTQQDCSSLGARYKELKRQCKKERAEMNQLTNCAFASLDSISSTLAQLSESGMLNSKFMWNEYCQLQNYHNNTVKEFMNQEQENIQLMEAITDAQAKLSSPSNSKSREELLLKHRNVLQEDVKRLRSQCNKFEIYLKHVSIEKNQEQVAEYVKRLETQLELHEQRMKRLIYQGLKDEANQQLLESLVQNAVSKIQREGADETKLTEAIVSMETKLHLLKTEWASELATLQIFKYHNAQSMDNLSKETVASERYRAYFEIEHQKTQLEVLQNRLDSLNQFFCWFMFSEGMSEEQVSDFRRRVFEAHEGYLKLTQQAHGTQASPAVKKVRTKTSKKCRR